MRALLLGGVLQALGIAAFALLTCTGTDLPAFTAVMAFDDFAISVAGVTLVAYMSSLTSLGYTATQYALLSSTYALAGKFLKGFSGAVVEGLTAQFGPDERLCRVFHRLRRRSAFPRWCCSPLLERQRRKAAINPA